MTTKLLKHIKRSTSKNGIKYFFDTRSKKRISLKEFTRRKKIQQSKTHKKKVKPKQIKIKKFNGRTTKGNDYFKRVRIDLDEVAFSTIEQRFKTFFNTATRRLKTKDRITFGNIKGFYVLPDETEPWERNTATFDFPDTRADYDINLGDAINKLLTDLADRIGKIFYDKGIVESFIITRFKIGIRRQT